MVDRWLCVAMIAVLPFAGCDDGATDAADAADAPDAGDSSADIGSRPDADSPRDASPGSDAEPDASDTSGPPTCDPGYVWDGAICATGGTIYYVDPDGDDGADGSAASPWRTLAHAATAVEGERGHTIHLNTGTFAETQTARVAPGVNVEGEGPSATVLTGTFALMISLESESLVEGAQTLRGFSIDGRSRALERGILVRGRHRVAIHDISIAETGLYGAQVVGQWWPEESLDPPPGLLEAVHIHHLTMINCASDQGSSSQGCLQIGHLDGADVHDIVIREDTGYGIKLSQGGWFRGLRVHDCDIEVPPMDAAWGADIAIELWNLSDDSEVYDNVTNNWISLVKGSRGDGTYSVRAHHNHIVMENYEKEAFEIAHGLSDVQIDHNYVRGGHWGVVIWGDAARSASNIVVHHNVFYDSDGDGVFVASRGESYDNVRVYNNVFDGYHSALAISVSDSGSVRDVELANNVLWNTARGLVALGDAARIEGTHLHHNLFVEPLEVITEWGSSASTETVAEDNVSVGDPSVRGTGERPDPFYRPASASSPGVEAGVDVGLPFSGSAPDIGPYEHTP